MCHRQQLSEEELERLEEACDMALELNASKHRIYEYVESRMSFIAPNLSLIIGASTAAKIMGEVLAPSGGRGYPGTVRSRRREAASLVYDTGHPAQGPRALSWLLEITEAGWPARSADPQKGWGP